MKEWFSTEASPLRPGCRRSPTGSCRRRSSSRSEPGISPATDPSGSLTKTWKKNPQFDPKPQPMWKRINLYFALFLWSPTSLMSRNTCLTKICLARWWRSSVVINSHQYVVINSADLMHYRCQSLELHFSLGNLTFDFWLTFCSQSLETLHLTFDLLFTDGNADPDLVGSPEDIVDDLAGVGFEIPRSKFL